MVTDAKGTSTPAAAVTVPWPRRDACINCRKESEEKIQKWRSVLRGLYLAVFFVAFGVGFYFTFISIPNMSVHRIYLVDHGIRNYASRHLYNESVSYGINVDMENRKNEAAMKGLYNQFGLRVIANKSASSDWEEEKQTLSCPCTKTTLSWTDYTQFYFLSYVRPDRKPYIKYIFPPEMEGRLGGIDIDNASAIDPSHVVRAPATLKSFKDFCNFLNNLPADLLIVQSQFGDCRDFVSPILSSVFDTDGVQPHWKDSRTSFYESPVLLDQKLFYSRTLGLLYGYVREKHTLMASTPAMMVENVTNRNIFLTGLTDIWIYVLDTFGANSSCSDTDFFTAAATRTFQDFAEQDSHYPYHYAVLLDQGQTFLGMTMNWTEYYNACEPRYCDVIDTNGRIRRAFTATAILGGLGTCVLLLAHLAIWPLSDSVLFYFCRQSCSPARPKVEQRTTTAHGHGNDGMRMRQNRG